MGLFSFLTQEIAIDLGTANTLIIMNDKVVVDEPSIVAKDIQTGNIVAIGKRAQQMHGKTHKLIETVRPLKDGVIADFQSAESMIRGMIKMINTGKSFFTPSLRMVVCIPSGITEVEKRAVRDSCEHAGAKEVYLIHEPMAAAIGIGIDVEEANMESARKFVVEQGMTWPNLYDKDGSTKSSFGMGVPITWYLNSKSEVAYKHIGVLKSKDQLFSEVEKYLGIKL